MRFTRHALLLAVSPWIFACSANTSEGASTTGPRTDAPVTATASAAPPAAVTSAPAASASPQGTGYLPAAGTRFAFRGEFRGKTIDTEVELRSADAAGEKLFYFAEIGGRNLIAPVFGMGAFAVRADGLYTADVLAVADVPKLSREKLELLMALPPKVGAKASVAIPAAGIVPAKSERYEVAAFERVTVPAGTFDPCVKIAVATEIDGEQESSTVWLAPGVGPVKVARATGRVDELTQLTPAP